MRRNEALLHLSSILNKCNELNLPCEPAIRHYGECVDEMVDDVMAVIQRLIDKPYNRCSRLTGIGPDEPIGIPSDKPARWIAIGRAMAIQENGTESIDDFAMLSGWDLCRQDI